MRKYLLPGALLVVIVGACAHPTPPPGYGPTTTAAQPATSQADQTVDVCDQARSLSATAASAIRSKADAATAALNSGDQTGLLQAVNDLKSLAADWADQLTKLAGRPIKPAVKQVLDDGAATIKSLASAVAPPPDAQAKLADFTARLTAACG